MKRIVTTLNTVGMSVESVRGICHSASIESGANITFNYSTEKFTLFTDGDNNSALVALKYAEVAMREMICSLEGQIGQGYCLN